MQDKNLILKIPEFQLNIMEYLFIQFPTADGSHVGWGSNVNRPGAHLLVGINARKPESIRIMDWSKNKVICMML